MEAEENQASRGEDALRDGQLMIRLRLVAWSVLTISGFLEAMAARHSMQDDGVNYLDMGDAILRGDWKMALNGVWSPLYPFLQSVALHLLKPSAYWQFTVVHCVNFVIYIFALVCLEFLLAAATKSPGARDSASDRIPLPRWTVFAIGYAVFLWSSLDLITVRLVAPDMLMSAFLYLAAGLLLQIWARPDAFSRFLLLGLVLGLGYLAKAPMFPMAAAFFLFALFADRKPRAIPRVLAGIAIFTLVSAPWFMALSRYKGHLTFGDSAKFNYLVHVNGASPGWYFQDLGSARGHYVHTVRKIFDTPPVYEFATPLRGTSPIAYDPSYWAEGAVPRVSLKRELGVIKFWVGFYLRNFFQSQSALFVGFLVLCFMGQHTPLGQQITARWPVWVVGLIGLAMYALVHAELRYVGVFFSLIWVALFSALTIESASDRRRLALPVAFAVVIATATPVLISVADDSIGIRRQANVQWQVAQDLQKMGVQPGDRVARLVWHFGLGWERLLGVTEVAQVPLDNAVDFWCAPREKQMQAIDALRPFHVTVFVAEQVPPSQTCAAGPEWTTVSSGMYYVLDLRKEKDAK